jgi:deoxycytidylate deaminase
MYPLKNDRYRVVCEKLKKEDILRQIEWTVLLEFFDAAAEMARQSTCKRGRCGTVIVLDNNIIASGFNQPPLNDERNRKCSCEFPLSNRLKPKSDITCCVHAEEDAIQNMLRDGGNRKQLKKSVLYFIRIDEAGEKQFSRVPYCTMCSRNVMHAGVNYFTLYCKDGPEIYDLQLYNDLSYQYHEKEKTV